MPHLNEKIDFTSEVFIVFENKVLLRKHDKYKVWMSVGGHIELGEDPVEAAVREVREEVGLVVTIPADEVMSKFNTEKRYSLARPQHVNRHVINEIHEHVTFIFYGQATSDVLKLSENEITDDCRWFSREELNANEEISEEMKFYAREALELFS